MGLVGGFRLRHGKVHGSPFGNRGTQVPTWNWFLAARWLKTIEFGRMFLISLKENVTSGTHPHEVVQFETIAVGPFPSSSFKGLVKRSASPEGLNIHRLVKLGSLPEVPFRVLLA